MTTGEPVHLGGPATDGRASDRLRPGWIPDAWYVELMSPSDRPVAVNDKAQMWLRYGVRLALIVSPETRTIVALPADGPARTFREDDALDCGEVLPVLFTCPVRDIFEP